MPSYTLTYFNGKGRAEVPRLLFRFAGIPFEDKRIDHGVWPTLKSETPFEVLPYLTVGSVGISMSGSIANYLAREFGLYGANNIENTRIDTVCNALSDITTLYTQILFAAAENKADCVTKLNAKVVTYAPGLEKLLEGNSGGNGYFVGNGITLADIAFFNTFEGLKNLKADVLGSTPKLNALYERVGANPKIAEWLKIRPVTPF